MIPTPEQIAALKEAAWAALDEMGVDRQSVCRATKARLRVAYEPFLEPDDEGFMPLDEARRIIEGVERG